MTITISRPSIGFPVSLFDLVNTDVQPPRPRAAALRAPARTRPLANDPSIPPRRADEDEERWDGLS